MYTFGRTDFKKRSSFLDKIKDFNLQKLKQLKWKDLTLSQKRKIIFGTIIFFVLMLLIGLFTQNDEEAYKSNINNFVKSSALYDVQSTAKTTSSAAHQLVIAQGNKMKNAKSKGYKTKVLKTESKIVSQKGNSIIGTTRVDTTEQLGTDTPANFTHLFVFQGQKVGAGWKISNMLETEAKKVNQ